MIVVTAVLIVTGFSLVRCTPPPGDALLVNQYHETIIKVIIETSIREVKITTGQSLTISSGTSGNVYVITNDNKVSNTVTVWFKNNDIETITLTADGILINGSV